MFCASEIAYRLQKHSDCLISLHRSEGQGRNMMEAMCFDTPVIATAYSGNMDFTTDENSLLVSYEMVDVDPKVNAPQKFLDLIFFY